MDIAVQNNIFRVEAFVEHGIISAMTLYSDTLHSNLDLKEIGQKMTGCPFEQNAVAVSYTHLLPWGSLTGIRPTKIALSRLEDGWKEDDIRRFMQETYMTSDEKINLSVEIAAREKRLMEPINYDSGYSL